MENRKISTLDLTLQNIVGIFINYFNWIIYYPALELYFSSILYFLLIFLSYVGKSKIFNNRKF